MLKKVTQTCHYIIKNARYVTINYSKIDKFIQQLDISNHQHYFATLPFEVMNMSTKNIIDFLLIYDAIIFSFWGDPKWKIETPHGNLDGSIALLYCLLKLFKDKESEQVFIKLSEITFKEFRIVLNGNNVIPLLKERYEIVKKVANVVVNRMKGSFYKFIKEISDDRKLFQIITNYFPSFEDKRIFNGKKIYFYKIAQLLTGDILKIIELKENKKVNYSNLVGCADYKIPQVLRAYEILEYNEELTNIVNNRIEINEGSNYEIEIRAAMIVVIDYIWKSSNQKFNRIDINNFIWSMGRDKTKLTKPYHLTRTTTY